MEREKWLLSSRASYYHDIINDELYSYYVCKSTVKQPRRGVTLGCCSVAAVGSCPRRLISQETPAWGVKFFRLFCEWMPFFFLRSHVVRQKRYTQKGEKGGWSVARWRGGRAEWTSIGVSPPMDVSGRRHRAMYAIQKFGYRSSTVSAIPFDSKVSYRYVTQIWM